MNGRLHFLLALVLAASCAPKPSTRPADVTSILETAEEDVRASVASNDFGLALAQHLPAGNAVWSPLSVTAAFGMLHLGARGESATQIGKALRWGSGNAHESVGQLLRDLQEDPNAMLSIANSVWVQQSYPIADDYLSATQKYYAATPHALDFWADPDLARRTINAAVAEQTDQEIKELLPPDSIPKITRAVLVNAILLDAKWVWEFPEANTKLQPFHTLEGSAVDVETMAQNHTLAYAHTQMFDAVELPYIGGLSALVVLPKENAFGEVSTTFNAATMHETLQTLKTHQVDLTLPKFTLHTNESLKAALQAMGITDVFDETRSDLSGLTTSERLMVSDVFHSAMIDVHEKGTKAAAATAIVAIPTSMPPKYPDAQMHVDRPFMFFVYEPKSEAIVFAARVVDPS